jgi:DNA-binding transcriptional MerR regulator
MVRKRDRHTRARAKRRRPTTPAPKTGWLIAELAALSGTPIRTLRYYVEQRLLRPSEFRGTATRYQRSELLRLFAILSLRSETKLSLSQIRAQLDAASDPQLEAWLLTRPLPPTVAALLGRGSTDAATAQRMTSAIGATSASAASEGALEQPVVETWQRLRLAPGLELLLRSDASPEVRGAAQRICADYLAK